MSVAEAGRVALKFFERGFFLWRWFAQVILPRHWPEFFGSVALIAAGVLAEAASYMIAVEFLNRWVSATGLPPTLANAPLLLGGGALVALLISAAACDFLGRRIGVRLIVGLETRSFAAAIGIVRNLRDQGLDLTDARKSELLFEAPRLLSRAILQLLGLGSSVILLATGGAMCVMLYPDLCLVLACFLAIISPVFLHITMRSTKIGHRLRTSGGDNAIARKEIGKKWLEHGHFDDDEVIEDISKSSSYTNFLNAYGERLMISPMIFLLINGVLSASVMISLTWMAMTLEASSSNLSKVVIFVVFLRVFFKGGQNLVKSVQTIAAFVPYFLTFLIFDDRVKLGGDVWLRRRESLLSIFRAEARHAAEHALLARAEKDRIKREYKQQAKRAARRQAAGA